MTTVRASRKQMLVFACGFFFVLFCFWLIFYNYDQAKNESLKLKLKKHTPELFRNSPKQQKQGAVTVRSEKWS